MEDIRHDYGIPSERLMQVLKTYSRNCQTLGVPRQSRGFTQEKLKADWGFWSKKDGEHHEVHLCERCYDKVKEFIESVGGKVRIENYL